MFKTKRNRIPSNWTLLSVILISTLLLGCTKYTSKTATTSQSNTSNSSQGYIPSTGNSSGTNGSNGTGTSGGNTSGGSTSSGTSGSGGTGSGTSGGNSSSGTGTTANIPKTYLQGFNYSNFINSSIFVNDSTQLLSNGYYTTLKAGNSRLAMIWGNHNSTALANYFLNPYSFYSYFVFDETPSTLGELLLNNGALTVPLNTALVRFVNIDPTTKNSSITFKLNNGNDKLTFPNRGYLDNKSDSSLAPFISINPSTAAIDFEVNGQVIKSFNQYFQGGKKYTVLAAFSKAYNYSTYFVAQHN